MWRPLRFRFLGTKRRPGFAAGFNFQLLTLNPASPPETSAACPDESCTAPQAPNESHASRCNTLPTPAAEGIAAHRAAPPAHTTTRFPTGSEKFLPCPALRQSSGANVPDKSAPES